MNSIKLSGSEVVFLLGVYLSEAFSRCNVSLCCLMTDQHCGVGEESKAAGAASAEVLQSLWRLSIQKEPGVTIFHRHGLKTQPVLCPSREWWRTRAFSERHQFPVFWPDKHKGGGSLAIPTHLSRPRDHSPGLWYPTAATEFLIRASRLHSLLPCQDCLAEASQPRPQCLFELQRPRSGHTQVSWQYHKHIMFLEIPQYIFKGVWFFRLLQIFSFSPFWF